MIRVASVAALLTIALILLGVRSAEPPADITIYNGNDVTTLDPQRISWIPDMRVARTVFEPLVRHDVLSNDFTIIPAVAESWNISDDGLVYTFRLRPDARWSNGKPVLADHFVYAWRRGMLPDMVADYAAMFMFVRGAQAFYDWRVEQLNAKELGRSEYADGDELWLATLEKFDQLVGLRSEDGGATLVVELERPTPYFLDLCAFAPLSPVYPPLVDQYERPDPTSGRIVRRPGWTRPPHLVSNGPFMLTDWLFKRGMRLEQNPYWWDRDSLNVRSIHIPSVNDPNSAVLAFRTGSVDLMSDVYAGYRGEIVRAKQEFLAEHAEEVARFEAMGLDVFEIARRLPDDPRNLVHIIPSFGTYIWNFNCSPTLADGRPNPFADPRVRRAFALVIDKRAIVDKVRRMGEPTASTLIPPGSIPGYASPAGLPNIGDAETEEERQAIIDRALALLAEAGYPDPASDFPITVSLLFNKDSGHDLVAQVVARNWQQHLGVSVDLEQKELKVFREDLKEHRFMTSRAGWFGDFGDPVTFLDIMKTGDGNNDRNFSNAHYDGLLEQAAVETDPAARFEILAEAERVLVEDEVPAVPIFHYVTLYMFDAKQVTGMSAHPRTEQNFFLLDVIGDGVGADQPRPMKPARPATQPTAAQSGAAG